MKKVKIHREPMTSDVIFKAVFGSDNEESKAALIELLNLILDRKEDPIIDLVYKNPFSISEDKNEKVIVMDVKVETSSREFIDIEMQVGNYDAYIKRTVYYCCKQLINGLEKGQPYGMMKKSIVISFVKDKIFSEHNKICSTFTLRENLDGYQLSDIMELHYIEMGKADWSKRDVDLLSPLERLCAYFRCSGDSKEQDFVEDLVRRGGKVISMADNILKKVSEDERMMYMRESREWAEMQISWEKQQERELGRKEGKELGEEIGKEIGDELGRKDVATKLKAMNMSLDDIAEATCLSKEVIEAL